nr:hypothetical protein [Rhizobium hidalgonense]
MMTETRPRRFYRTTCWQTKEPLTIEEMNEIAASSWAGSSSEDVRGLMDRERLRDLLIEGASSEPTGPVDDSYFDALRDRAGR